MATLQPIDDLGQPEGPSDEEISEGIAAKAALVAPILREFYTAANDNQDFWLKKKSLRIFAEWIMSLQDVGTLLTQQLEAAKTVLAAQEKELEELRPVKNKIWTPFS